MRINPRNWSWLTGAHLCLVLLLTFALVVHAVAQNRNTDPKLRGEGTLKVMTYNTFVGTEYNGVTDKNLAVVLQAGTNMILDARNSDPPGRAQAVARQIAATKPHLVSLQEVATWSTGPSPDNLTVEFDYLQLLLDALAAQGQHYAPVASLKTWEATMPTSIGLYVRNSWRVVILARTDLDPGDFSVTNVQAATWSVSLTLSVHLYALDGNPVLCPVALRSDRTCRMPMPRGWVSADVTYRDKQFRIIGGHLDSASALLEVPQALELLNGPANTALPVIVAADLNADCSNSTDATYATCVNFRNAGFLDAWAAANPGEPGYTKVLPVMTMRSDYVMARGRFKAQAAVLVGEDPGDKTASGLWPSDHCGVVARLQLPGEE